MEPKLSEKLRWGDLQIYSPCGAWRAESSSFIRGEDASHSFLWKYLPCFPIVFVK